MRIAQAGLHIGVLYYNNIQMHVLFWVAKPRIIWLLQMKVYTCMSILLSVAAPATLCVQEELDSTKAELKDAKAQLAVVRQVRLCTNCSDA